jgi:Cu/Ag efflux pump CusA
MSNIGRRITKDLLAIPGIATVEQQVGRAEAGEDTFPPSESEFHVELGKVSGHQEERILARIREVLASYPGLETEALTFLGDRIGESLSGETAAIVISAFGPDLDELDAVAAKIAATIATVPGAVNIQIQTPPGAPSLAITLDPEALAPCGVNAVDAYDAIEAAFQGRSVAEISDGQRLTEVAVTMPSISMKDPEAAGAILVNGTGGVLAPLSSVASIALSTGRATISHDGGRRRQVVTANAEGSDIAGLTARIKQAIAGNVVAPLDVYIEFSGAAEGEAAARSELLGNVVFAAIGVIVLLVLAFGGGRPAILILSSAPSSRSSSAAAWFRWAGLSALLLCLASPPATPSCWFRTLIIWSATKAPNGTQRLCCGPQPRGSRQF